MAQLPPGFVLDGQQPQGDPVIAVDPYKQAEEARKQKSDARAEDDQKFERDRFGKEQVNKSFDNVGKLRDDFNKLPEVKSYRVAVQQADQAINTGEGPQADLALTYAFAKVMDPDSVVREAEQGMITNSQPWFQAAVEKAKKQFGMDGAGNYTPEARRAIRQQIINSVASRRKLYGGKRAYFSDLAGRYGFEPIEVVGPDDGEQYLPGFQAYDQKQDGADTPPLGADVADERPDGQVLLGYRQGPSGEKYPVYGAPGTSLDGPPSMGDDSLQQGGISAYDMQTDPGGFKSLAVQGATSGLSDEIAGVTGGIGNLLSGGDVAEGYTRRRDAERAKLDYYRKQSPIAGTAAELLGGLATGGLAKAPASVAGYAMQGAGFGGLAGFGYGEGAANSGLNALIGAAGGGVIGGAVGKFAAPVRNDLNMDVVTAGQRQGIPVRQADARPELRGQYAASESTPNAGPLIREARAADTSAIESRVAEIGGGPVNPDPYATGKTVQAAGQRYIAKTKQQANRLYDRAREASGDATVTARNADAVLDANITELQAAGENSNKAAISYLQGLRDDIDRGLSLSSVQNLRTNMRGQISERGLTGTDTERRVGQVIEAMTQDLTEQLPQEASTALRAADKFYRERQEFINGTLKEFMGSRGNPLGAEQAATRLASMAGSKGKFDKFSSMWNQLEPSEQTEITKQIAYSLGRDGKGNFSPALFLNSLDPSKGMSPRAIRLVFGKDGAEALADLRTLTQAKSEAMNRISPSGQAIAGQSRNLRTMIMAAFGFGAGDVTGAVAAPLAERFLTKFGEERAARMLLNPDFTKWIKNAPNTTNPKAIDRYFGKLAGMSSIAANDNQAFTQALIEVVKQSPRRSAAEEKDDAGQKPPQQ